MNIRAPAIIRKCFSSRPPGLYFLRHPETMRETFQIGGNEEKKTAVEKSTAQEPAHKTKPEKQVEGESVGQTCRAPLSKSRGQHERRQKAAEARVREQTLIQRLHARTGVFPARTSLQLRYARTRWVSDRSPRPPANAIAALNTAGLRVIESSAPATIRFKPSAGRRCRLTPSPARINENSPI
jgi:hypothetical protein